MTAKPSLRIERIILYDGVCGLCDRVVRWVLDHDPEGRFLFAPLQGETAAALRERRKDVPAMPETVILVTRSPGSERVLLRSRAAFEILRVVGGCWSWLAMLSVLPVPVTDWLYGLIARSRYQIFGRLDACRIPSPFEAPRFLP